jgi:hypothetical protein
MNLIHQFPDVSLQMRNRVKWNKKGRQEKRMPTRHLKDDPELVLFYDNEFKKWHYMLILIIALGIACLYSVVLAASGIFQWVIMTRNSFKI